MFGELFESVTRPSSKRKRWAVAISVAGQAICLMILVLVPLIYTQALPRAILNTVLVALPGRASQPASQTPTARSGPHSFRLFRNGVLIAPGHIPLHANVFGEAPLPPEDAPIQGPMGDDSVLNLLSVAPAAADRVGRPAVPTAPQRMTVTSTIEAAKLISRVQPIYPPLAIQARIQGNVVLHAIIGKEGAVRELQVLSGHPLLVNSALDAVRQWRYSPTLLNGQAVEVETTITVTFFLAQ